MFLSLKTLYRKRTVIWPFYFYTIIRTLSKDLMSDDTYVSTPPDADAFINSAAYLGNKSQIEACLTGQWSEYSSIISAGLSDAFEGKTTIEEAVKTIDEQANTTVFK